MPRLLAAAPLLVLLALAGCAGGPAPRFAYGSYVGGHVPLDCAPFARALAGVSLSGSAAGWWRQAAGRYARTPWPSEGSLLVFRASARLPDGHVAVVTRVLDRRRVLVTQANWVHHRVTRDQLVLDVSRENDWTEVRVWWPPSGQMGIHDYPTYGFIRPAHPHAHDRLEAATRHAIAVALRD